MTSLTPPILFLVFNRPDKTRLAFERLRAARPSRLYIAGDGPRDDHPTDTEACAQTRAIADDIDWPCNVQTLFQDQNLGCRQGVTTALDWFFDHEPEGIIVEDDILLDPSFFPYAAEMLERYRDDPKVMTIGAANVLQHVDPSEYCPEGHSYVFSIQPQIWGWAGWRSTWELYDRTFDDLESAQSIAALKARGHPQYDTAGHWMNRFRRTRSGKIDAWSYGLFYTQWVNGGYCAVPTVNMMENIGFDATATHTVNPDSPQANLRAAAMHSPVNHPDRIAINTRYDAGLSKHVNNVRRWTLSRRIKRWLKGL